MLVYMSKATLYMTRNPQDIVIAGYGTMIMTFSLEDNGNIWFSMADNVGLHIKINTQRQMLDYMVI